MVFTWLGLPNNNSVLLADSFREGFMDERIERVRVECQELGKAKKFLKIKDFQ